MRKEKAFAEAWRVQAELEQQKKRQRVQEFKQQMSQNKIQSRISY